MYWLFLCFVVSSVFSQETGLLKLGENLNHINAMPFLKLINYVKHDETTQMQDMLMGDNDYTLFYPNNLIWEEMDPNYYESLMTDTEKRNAFSKRHFYKGKLISDNLIGTHESLNGVTITVEGTDTFHIKGPDGTIIPIIGEPIIAENGVIYSIDGMILDAKKKDTEAAATDSGDPNLSEYNF